MAVALILAAGRGERLEADRPKALVELAGRPLVQWSVDALRGVAAIEQIVLALPSGVQAPSGTVGVEGGQVRSQSVARALGVAGPGDPVLVHDAARPLLTTGLAETLIAALQRESDVDAVIAAAPVTDTVKRVRDWEPKDGGGARGGVVLETLDRSQLWAVQTPQVFRRGALERALEVSDEVLAQATDDAWLIERAGGKVVVVRTQAENLKVTTSLDLALAEMLLARRKRSQAPPA